MSDIDIFTMIKQSAERRTRAVDFSNKLANGVTITGATIAAVNLLTQENVASSILASTTGTVSGGNVSFIALAGTNNTDYRVTVTATLSNSDILTADVMLRVRDY